MGSSAALIVHRMPQPERLVAAAGTIWAPEQTWQLDQWGPDGHVSLWMAQRPLVDPDAVRRAEVGEAWVVAAGRSLHLQVAETPYGPQPAELPTPHRDGLAVVQSGRPGSSTYPTRSQQRRRSWRGAGPTQSAEAADRVAPTWDAQAELAALTAPPPAPPQSAAGVAGLADPHPPCTEDPAMTDDEMMHQLSQGVRNDDLLTAEERRMSSLATGRLC